jgi:hypothetical protein
MKVRKEGHLTRQRTLVQPHRKKTTAQDQGRKSKLLSSQEEMDPWGRPMPVWPPPPDWLAAAVASGDWRPNQRHE